MRKTSLPITLNSSDRVQLEQWQLAHGTPQQVALRCRIILGALAGEQNKDIAARLGIAPKTVENHLTRALAQLTVRLRRGGRQ